MSLKLFRSTGYASVFEAGETRIATHPGWVILATSLWAGLACNALLWRAVAGPGGTGPWLAALTFALLASGTAALLMGLLAWGNALKPVVLVLLLVAAWLATRIWVQDTRLDAALPDLGLQQLLRGTLLPWQLAITLPLLVVAPIALLRLLPVKRMSLARQTRLNLLAALLGAGACMAALSRLAPGVLTLF